MLTKELQNLKPSERLELVEELWDSLTDLPEAIPFTEAQRLELDRRLDRYASTAENGIPWEDVQRRIERQE